MIFASFSFSQIDLIGSASGSHNNTDGPITDPYTVDISCCTSIQMTLNWDGNGFDWVGSGNLESQDECPTAGSGSCSDVVGQSPTSDCFECWDYFHAELILNGSNVFSDTYGFTTADAFSGSIDSGIFCTDPNSGSATVNIIVQNWAGDETWNYNTLQLLCWEATPDPLTLPSTCAAADLNLDGLACNVGDVNQWNWTAGGASIANPSAQNTTASGTTDGETITLTTTDVNSCTASTSAAVVHATIPTPPTITADIQPADEQCPCGEILFGITPFIPSYTYDWTSSDGQTATGIDPVWSGSITGTYFVPCSATVGDVITIDVTATDPGSMCTATGTYTFTIVDPPVVTIDLSPSTVCDPDPFTLTANPAGASMYEWSGPMGYTNTGQSITLNPSTGFGGVYTVTVTTAAECQSTADIMVDVVPEAVVDVSGGGGMCEGECAMVPINISSTNLTGVVDVSIVVQGFPLPGIPIPGINSNGSIFLCYDEAGILPTVTGDVVHLPTSIPAGSYTLELAVTQPGNPCPIRMNSNTVTIDLFNAPTATIMANPLIMCEGDNLTLDDIGGTPPGSWDFSGPGVPVNTTNQPTTSYFALTPANTGLYSVVVSDNNGCTAESSVMVTINPAPVINDTEVVLGCLDGFGNVIYMLSDWEDGRLSDVSYTYNWFLDPAYSAAATDPHTIPAGGGTIYLEVIDPTTMCNERSAIMLGEHPMLDITISNDPMLPCEGGDVTITALVNSSSAITNWSWDDASATAGTGNTPSVIIPNLTVPPNNQMYTLTVEDENGCTGIFTHTIDITPQPIIEVTDTLRLEACSADMNPSIDFDLTSTLDSLTNSNSSIIVTWYSDSLLTNMITSPNPITEDTVFYATINQNGCESTFESVFFSITNGGMFQQPNVDPVYCESFTFPSINPSTPNSAFFDGPGGTGTMYMPGEMITIPGSYTFFVFDPVDNCFTGEPQIDFEILSVPELLVPGDMVVCEEFTLDPISVTGTFTDAYYLTTLTGTGSPQDTLQDGQVITTTQTIYVGAANGICTVVDSILIDVRPTPIAGMDSVFTVCEGYDGLFNFMTIIGNPDLGGEFAIGVPDALDSTLVSVMNLTPGTYGSTYTIDDDICGVFTSNISIEVLPNVSAGTIDTLTLCNADDMTAGSIADLFVIAGSPADMSGVWTDENGDVVADPTMVDFTNVPAGFYQFDYTITTGAGTADFCNTTGGMNSVWVEVLQQPYAGDPNPVSTCPGSLIMLDQLLLNVDTTSFSGVFTTTDAIIQAGNIFNTTGLMPGDYSFTYMIDGLGVCNPSSNTITITITEDNLSAGDDNAATLCTGVDFDLVSLINGDAGGVFQVQGTTDILPGSSWNVNIDNGTNFIVEYIIGAQGGCMSSDTAELNITINLSPELLASIDNDLICGNECAEIIVDVPLGQGPFDAMISVSDNSGSAMGDPILYSSVQFYQVCAGSALGISNDTVYVVPGFGPFTFSIESVVDQNMCPSQDMVNINFDINEAPMTLIDSVFCGNGSVMVNGELYDQTRPNGTETIMGGAVSGCDSIIIVDLSFSQEGMGLEDGTYCRGEIITLNGTAYDENSPTGMDTIQIMGQCDSIVMVDLTFTDFSLGAETGTYCRGQQVTLNGSIYDELTPSGMDTLFGGSVSGCDSIVMVDLIFNDFSIGAESGTYCPELEVFLNGSVYTQANPTGQDTLFGGSAQGCDSIVMVSLNFFTTMEGDTVINDVCADLTVTVGDRDFTFDDNMGPAILAGASANGCDSTVNVIVNFTNNDPDQSFPEVCEGDSYTSPSGMVYDASNPMGSEFLGLASNGCDSVLQIELSFILNDTFDLIGSYCSGESLMVNGMTYDINRPMGQEVIPGAAVNGCDSVVNIMMTFDVMYDFIVQDACDAASMGMVTIVDNGTSMAPLTITTTGGASFTATQLPYSFELPAGTNDLTITDASMCMQQESVTVGVLASGSFGLTQTSTGDNTFSLSVNTDIMYDNISWTPASVLDCANCDIVNATVFESTEIIASISFGNGCTRSDTAIIVPERSVFVYIPDAFSPNDDITNDRFFVQVCEECAEDVTIKEFKIYDRWGNKVFSADGTVPNDPSLGWDGRYTTDSRDTETTNGVYVYLIILEVNGELEDRIYKGDIALIR